MDKPSSGGGGGGGGGGRRLTRQTSSRLQMHAPSSLKVAHADAGADVVGWNAAIPLLSPLDAASAPRAWAATAEHECRREERRRQPTAVAAVTTLTAAVAAVEGKREEAAAEAAASAWKHPAAPFYYEPAPPGAGPGFLLSLT